PLRRLPVFEILLDISTQDLSSELGWTRSRTQTARNPLRDDGSSSLLDGLITHGGEFRQQCRLAGPRSTREDDASHRLLRHPEVAELRRDDGSFFGALDLWNPVVWKSITTVDRI